MERKQNYDKNHSDFAQLNPKTSPIQLIYKARAFKAAFSCALLASEGACTAIVWEILRQIVW